jgi:hypothetical protein
MLIPKIKTILLEHLWFPGNQGSKFQNTHTILANFLDKFQDFSRKSGIKKNG